MVLHYFVSVLTSDSMFPLIGEVYKISIAQDVENYYTVFEAYSYAYESYLQICQIMLNHISKDQRDNVRSA